MKKIISSILSALLFFSGMVPAKEVCAKGMIAWDFPSKEEKAKEPKDVIQLASLPKERSERREDQVSEAGNQPDTSTNLPVQYPTEDFDPVLEPGMILVIESVDWDTRKVLSRMSVPVLSDEVVSVPGLGALEIVGKKLSDAAEVIRKMAGKNFRVGLMLGNVQTVQVLGKVQKPGNYPGYMKMSYLIAEASDRVPGSNFKVHFLNGADRSESVLRYEDIVKGKTNPLVPPGSIVYFPPSAGSIFGEMTEKQVNLAYLVVITLAALGVTAIAKQ
jgi:hypothetical protein